MLGGRWLSLLLIAGQGLFNAAATPVFGGTITIGAGSSNSSVNLGGLSSIDLVVPLTLATGTQPATTPLAALTKADPLGTLENTFNYSITRMILDAPRHRIYATDNTNNRVIVFDTTTNTMLTTVLVGSAPYGLAMTPDGNTLYVANSGSNTPAISAVDLNTLTVSSTLPSSIRLYNLVVGLNGRIYASTNGSSTGIVQIDPANAANNLSFGSYNFPRLAISPDLKTLYIGESNYYGTLSPA